MMQTYAEQRRELYRQLGAIHAELERIDEEETGENNVLFDHLMSDEGTDSSTEEEIVELMEANDPIIASAFEYLDKTVASKPKRRFPATLPIRSIRASLHTDTRTAPKDSSTFDIRCYRDV